MNIKRYYSVKIVRKAMLSNKKKPVPELNIPKCPTCGSTNIKKISGLSKVGSVAVWGLLSRKVHKQWHCNNCGS